MPCKFRSSSIKHPLLGTDFFSQGKTLDCTDTRRKFIFMFILVDIWPCRDIVSAITKSHPLVIMQLEEVWSCAQSCNGVRVPGAGTSGFTQENTTEECHAIFLLRRTADEGFVSAQFEVWSCKGRPVWSVLSLWSLILGCGEFNEWFAPGQAARNKVPGLLKQLGYFLLYSGAWAEVQMPGNLNEQFSAVAPSYS